MTPDAEPVKPQSPVEYVELNLANYDADQVAQLNEWAIWAHEQLELAWSAINREQRYNKSLVRGIVGADSYSNDLRKLLSSVENRVCMQRREINYLLAKLRFMSWSIEQTFDHDSVMFYSYTDAEVADASDNGRCIDPRQLDNISNGRSSMITPVRRHLSQCAACRQTFEFFERYQQRIPT